MTLITLEIICGRQPLNFLRINRITEMLLPEISNYISDSQSKLFYLRDYMVNCVTLSLHQSSFLYLL